MHQIVAAIVLAMTALTIGADGPFLFVTFKGEQTPTTEQVYFAVSEDGLTWEALKREQPILVSDVGDKGVRDPYLLRSQDGKRYYLLGTDLSINLHPDWGRASTAGSKAILIWESEDLVRWSEPRRVEIAAEDAGCAWAPEAIYDKQSHDYLVFWASRNRSDNFGKFRIWASRTSDFRAFSKPFVYIDEPHPVIDTSVVESAGTYYRFTKNEHDKSISLEVSDTLMGPWSSLDSFSLASLRGVEGPQAFVLRGPNAGKPAQWCLLLDHYGRGEGYHAYLSNELESGRFEPAADLRLPFRFRHGSVLRISDAEYRRLKSAFPSTAKRP